MIVLAKGARLISANRESTTQKDIWIVDGVLRFKNPSTRNPDIVFQSKELYVSIGWVDLGCLTNDPGFESKDDFSSISRAAASGGFTKVACLPNTNPITQSKAGVEYIKSKNQGGVEFLPYAAISKNLEGLVMNELLDLRQAGSIAFTDGLLGIQNSSTLVKSLEYLQNLNGLLIQRPQSNDLADKGLMNEGISSTKLGLRGIPSIAEELILKRDIDLLEHIGGRIHFSCITTAGSVKLIREAKKKGLSVTCDTAAHYLAFDDSYLEGFDTNYKVNPPFRTKSDIEALLKGLADGTIDAVISDHQGQDEESKNLEFDLAEFGISSLETTFSTLVEHTKGKLKIEEIVEKLSHSPRRILGLENVGLNDGDKADITLFDPTTEWIYTAEDRNCKSLNSPFLNKRMKGKVLGTIHNGHIHSAFKTS